MTEPNRQEDRQNLLADVAEMYFLEGKNQAEIAQSLGMTRSNVSRLLTEARHSGIVQIHVNRPNRENATLAQELVKRFALVNARIVNVDQNTQLLTKLGQVAGNELLSHLKPGWVLGTSWGTAINATVEQLEVQTPISGVRVAQLLGALGARIKGYDGHAIVRRLEQKLNAEGIYINAPFLVEGPTVAQSLLENKSVVESLSFAREANIALLGVGSTELEHSSYYLANYVTREEMLSIQSTGAIGDVCGRFFNLDGEICAKDFQKRLIGITVEDLLHIPLRIGVAGGPAKVDPIIGALRGGLVNILISDEATVNEVLRRTK